MHKVGFEPAIPGSERLQAHAFDCVTAEMMMMMMIIIIPMTWYITRNTESSAV
jgi:hypothetical protein